MSTDRAIGVCPRRRTGSREDRKGVRPAVIGFACLLLATLLLALPAVAAAAPGDLLWNFHSASAGDDAATGIVVDGDDDATVAFEWNTEYWNPFEDSALGLLSLTSAGGLRFGRTYGVGNGVEEGLRALTIGSDGTFWLAGWTRPDDLNRDYLLLRYANDGTLSGERLYDGASHLGDYAKSVAVGADGSAYVTGLSVRAYSGGETRDMVTVCYGPAGNKVWTRRFRSPTGRDAEGRVVAVRGSAVYVAGVCGRYGRTDDDIVLVKYDAGTGVTRWTRYYDDAKHRNDWVTDMVVTSRAVYLGGMGRRANTSGGGDALLVKYTSGGSRSWVKWVSGAGRDVWNDLAWAKAGYLQTTGMRYFAATDEDAMTASWKPDGTRRWLKTISGLGDSAQDDGVALAVDGSGRTYVACAISTADNKHDIRVVAYSLGGTRLWLSSAFSVEAGKVDRPTGIALASDGVWVCGTSEKLATGDDYVVLKYDR
jgi:hypothetical protein